LKCGKLICRRDLNHSLRHTGDAFNDNEFLFFARIPNDDFHHEPVDLSVGQRIRPFALDRILRSHHQKRRRKHVRFAGDCHLALLHDFEQRTLHLRGGTVDFIREQKVRKYRPERCREIACLGVVYAIADEIGRHQIRCELNAPEGSPNRLRERFDSERLGEARDAFDQ